MEEEKLPFGCCGMRWRDSDSGPDFLPFCVGLHTVTAMMASNSDIMPFLASSGRAIWGLECYSERQWYALYR